MKDDKLISAIDGIDDGIIEDAAPRGKKAFASVYRIAALAACFALTLGIALGSLPRAGKDDTPPVTGGQAPELDRPFPEVPLPTKSLATVMENFLLSDADSYYPEYGLGFDQDDGGAVPEYGMTGEANGSYVEVTDNQIEGIIEADLYKTTDKYIFRYENNSLGIYSIDGENSRKISSVYISSRGSYWNTDMFLSADGKTVTVIQEEYSFELEQWYENRSLTYIYSIDVSDVSNPKIVKTLGVLGAKAAVRKIDGKIYVITKAGFDRKKIDIDEPVTYIPGMIDGDELLLCNGENIYYPDEIKSASYVYVNVLCEDDLTLEDEYALLTDYATWVTGVHFTENHIAVEYQTGRQIREEDGYPISEACTYLDLIDFSEDTLRYRGSLEIRGWAETGQYGYDEKDGYLRVVTSAREWKRYFTINENVSLYVYDLNTMTLAASVEDFAPEGESATAVRFEGDKLYVCTAETASFTDPVFFFDLSDYGNITEVNTGYIEGFSSTLIDYGEGYLLGIGRESREKGKIEVYRREGEAVVSVAEFIFFGTPCSKYKTYLIDREKNIFGFASDSYRNSESEEYRRVYVILQLDESGLHVLEELSVSTGSLAARAFLRDGYVYYSGTEELKVVKIDEKG